MKCGEGIAFCCFEIKTLADEFPETPSIMEPVPETAFRPHALNPTLLNKTGGIVTEAPGMPQYGDLITVNSISLGHTVDPALLHATASTGTVTANTSSCLKA